jgi:hypothetical protein
MESEIPVCPQKHACGLYPELDEPRSHPPTLLYYDAF